MKTRPNREGIPWNEYRYSHLLPALPIGFLIHWATGLLSFFVAESAIKGPSQVPRGAIVVMFHPEWLYFAVARKTAGRVREASAHPFSWLGLHHFLSYFGSITAYFWNYQCARYDREKNIKPYQVTKNYLIKNPDFIFFIRTDSGGPYGRVRESLIKLSLETGRPLVCERQWSNKSFPFLKHHIPLPFTRIQTAFSEPISSDELKNLGIEKGREHVQKIMDLLPIENSPNR